MPCVPKVIVCFPILQLFAAGMSEHCQSSDSYLLQSKKAADGVMHPSPHW